MSTAAAAATAIPPASQTQTQTQTPSMLTAASPITPLGSAAFSFPRTAGSGVTTGPLHSPTTTRLAPLTSTTTQDPPSYFDDALAASTTASSFGSHHSRAKSATSAHSFSSASTMASTDSPRTPRISLSSSPSAAKTVDRLSLAASSNNNAAAAAAAPGTGPAPATPSAMGRVPSLGLAGTTSYDVAKSRVLSQPWAPTYGSRWAAPRTISSDLPASTTPDSTSLASAASSQGVPVFPASAGDGAPGRLGTLFRKLSLSTSPHIQQRTPSASPQQPMGTFGTAATSTAPDRPGFHHHRHHSMSIPPSFRRPASPPSSSQQQQPESSPGPIPSQASPPGGGGVFSAGGSALAIDDLLPSTPSASAPAPAAPYALQHPIARSEPSSSPVLTSGSLGSVTSRGRKPSFSQAASRKRRPSPTGERLLSMGHFGHH